MLDTSYIKLSKNKDTKASYHSEKWLVNAAFQHSAVQNEIFCTRDAFKIECAFFSDF